MYFYAFLNVYNLITLKHLSLSSIKNDRTHVHIQGCTQQCLHSAKIAVYNAQIVPYSHYIINAKCCHPTGSASKTRAWQLRSPPLFWEPGKNKTLRVQCLEPKPTTPDYTHTHNIWDCWEQLVCFVPTLPRMLSGCNTVNVNTGWKQAKNAAGDKGKLGKWCTHSKWDGRNTNFADGNRYGGGGEFQHLPDCIYLQTHEIQYAIWTLRLTDYPGCQNCTVLHH